MKVAYYSPLPPQRSGVADYSALLLPALRRHVDVEVVKHGRTKPVRDADVALYHVGNSPEAHAWIVDALRKRPGVVVLHELVLHHLVAGMTIGRKDGPAYLAAMQRDAGVAGRLLAHGVLDGSLPPLWEVRPHDFPLAGEILDRATALIVHSRYVEEGARCRGYDGPLHRIPHPAWPDPGVESADLGPGRVVGSFGHLNASKRAPELLRAFELVRERRPDARLLLVGPAAPRYALPQLPEGVVREDYVDERRLWQLMARADVVVSLRAPTMGETSGTAVRALVIGRPLVVSDLGWFAELPDEVAVKIAPGEGETEALVAALERLLGDDEARAARGEAARALAQSEHDVERVAERYAAVLEEAAGGAAVRDDVLREVAEAAAQVGIGPDSPEAVELAAELRRAGLGG